MATRKFLWLNPGDASGFVYSESDLTSADSVDLQGAGIINLADPVNAQDAATKHYGDNQTAVEDQIRTADAVGITQYAAVYYSANDTVSNADSSALGKVGVVGIAPSAIAATTSGAIRREGVVPGCLTGATAGHPYFLGHSGLPVLASALVSGDRICRLGYAKNATDLEISFEDIGKK